eukprot:COSAG04_NODE_731_length_10733_cov_3.264435_9_plen_325_part_00
MPVSRASASEGLLGGIAEKSAEAAAGAAAGAAASKVKDSVSELAHQVRDGEMSAAGAVDAVGSLAEKITSTAAGQRALAQAQEAKKMYDAQTTGRITKAIDGALRGVEAKLEAKAAPPELPARDHGPPVLATAKGALLHSVAGTIGGIADQAAGPAAAAAAAEDAAVRAAPSRSPPALPTPLQISTQLATEQATTAAAKDAYKQGGGGRRGLSKDQVQGLIQEHFRVNGGASVSDEYVGRLFDAFDADHSGLVDSEEWQHLYQMIAAPPPPATEPWAAPLFGCLADPMTCLLTAVCPCVIHGRIAAEAAPISSGSECSNARLGL